MKLSLLLLPFFFTSLTKAQEPIITKRIDSIARVITQRAFSKEHQIIKGTLLLEGDKTSSIRFHLVENITEMIVVESNLRENATLYYFKDRKLIYVVNFTNGNYNEIKNSFYLADDTACKKEGSVFTKVNPAFLLSQVSSYFDLFKEQLIAK